MLPKELRQRSDNPRSTSATLRAPERVHAPEAASWTAEGGTALLMYEDVRRSASPRETLLNFLESASQAGAKTAGWDVEDLRTEPAG